MNNSPVPNKITTVFFDIGGVLVSSFGKGFIEYASQILGIEKSQLRRLINETEIPLQKGEIEAHPNKQHIEFWYRVLKKAREEGITPTREIPERHDLAQLWVKPYLENVRVYEDMIRFVRELKESGNVKILTLSNIQEPHVLILKKLLGEDFDNLFDGHVLSNEVHARKPEAEIYQIALDRAGCKSPEEAVFIDDSITNIEGAGNIGMQVIHHQEGDAITTKERLRNLGVVWTEISNETKIESDLPKV